MDLFGNLRNVLDEYLASNKKLSKREIILHSYIDELKTDFHRTIELNQNSLYRQINTVFTNLASSHANELIEIRNILGELNCSIRDLTQSVLQLKQMYVDGVNYASSELQPIEKIDLPIKYPVVYYAEMIDSFLPIGFIQSNLHTEDTQCAFRLEIQDKTYGKYQFVEDSRLQAEILSAFNPIITDSSEYENLPSSPSKIIIRTPGSIKLVDGIWQIEKKQYIEFE